MSLEEEASNPPGSIGPWSDGFPTTVVLFLSVFIGLVWCTRGCKNLPPGPLFPLNLLLKVNSNKRYLVFVKYAREYGPIYSFRFGSTLTVVLNTITLAKEALVEKAEVFSERHVPKAVNIQDRGLKGRPGPECTIDEL